MTEFHEKLQILRKQKGITQEELAEALYVSRTAISKWESGRGYPNIESLKALAKFYKVTIDELLSGEELLILAEEDTKQKEMYFRDLVFGLLDLSTIMLLFLPLFRAHTEKFIQGVSLLGLTELSLWLKMIFYIVVFGSALLGGITLAFPNWNFSFRVQNKSSISLALTAFGVLLFTMSIQPYAAAFLLVILLIKVFMLIKRQ